MAFSTFQSVFVSVPVRTALLRNRVPLFASLVRPYSLATVSTKPAQSFRNHVAFTPFSRTHWPASSSALGDSSFLMFKRCMSGQTPPTATDDSMLTIFKERMGAIVSGSKRLVNDFRAAREARQLLPESLKREHFQVTRRSARDLKAALPWFILFWIPFVGYSVPLVAILRPRWLPEPFWSDRQRTEFWEEDALQRAAQSQKLLNEKEANEIVKQAIVEEGPAASKCAQALLLTKSTVGGDAKAHQQLVDHLEYLQEDDRLLRDESPSVHALKSLDTLNLQWACQERGLQACPHKLHDFISSSTQLEEKETLPEYLQHLLESCAAYAHPEKP